VRRDHQEQHRVCQYPWHRDREQHRDHCGQQYQPENSVGIFSVVLPFLSIAMTEMLTISGNQVLNNDRPNPVTDPNDILSRLPSGIGMLFLGTDQTTFTTTPSWATAASASGC
jgi:hypothetical protein